MIVVGGVIEKDGKFLLVQEAKEKVRGKWNLPAGHLDPNETILEGAKREIYEESGLNVELSGILQIGNIVQKDKIFVSIIFSTKILEENITFNKDEILDIKWFTYEEIMNMKDELREYNLIAGSITQYVNNKIIDMDLIKILK